MIQKEKHKQTIRIFLSYAVEDKTCAHKLRKILSRRPNLHIFTTEMLSAGEDWEGRLKDELSRCDIFVVLLSENSVDSKWVLHELGAAWAINKLIVPVVTHPELVSKIPMILSKVQIVEIKDIEKPEVIAQILRRYEEVTTLPNSS